MANKIQKLHFETPYQIPPASHVAFVDVDYKYAPPPDSAGRCGSCGYVDFYGHVTPKCCCISTHSTVTRIPAAINIKTQDLSLQRLARKLSAGAAFWHTICN